MQILGREAKTSDRASFIPFLPPSECCLITNVKYLSINADPPDNLATVRH
jgi:hypothetical protein